MARPSALPGYGTGVGALLVELTIQQLRVTAMNLFHRELKLMHSEVCCKSQTARRPLSAACRCCSRKAWQTRPPAGIQQLCLDTLRDVRATAILDHYRRLKQQMTGSFDSVSTSSLDDDDTPCPLECVREVKTGELNNHVGCLLCLIRL